MCHYDRGFHEKFMQNLEEKASQGFWAGNIKEDLKKDIFRFKLDWEDGPRHDFRG